MPEDYSNVGHNISEIVGRQSGGNSGVDVMNIVIGGWLWT